MLGFKSLWSAAKIIAHTETMHVTKKRQMADRRQSRVRCRAVPQPCLLILIPVRRIGLRVPRLGRDNHLGYAGRPARSKWCKSTAMKV